MMARIKTPPKAARLIRVIEVFPTRLAPICQVLLTDYTPNDAPGGGHSIRWYDGRKLSDFTGWLNIIDSRLFVRRTNAPWAVKVARMHTNPRTLVTANECRHRFGGADGIDDTAGLREHAVAHPRQQGEGS